MNTPQEIPHRPTNQTETRMLARIRETSKASPYAAILLQHGTVRASAVQVPWPTRGPARRPFASAFLSTAEGLSRNHEVIYVEGFAYNPEWDVFIEHAWVEDTAGTVYETTLDNPHRFTYLGIRFRFDDVATALLQAQEPVLFGDWARDFPVLQAHRKCCRLPGRATERA